MQTISLTRNQVELLWLDQILTEYNSSVWKCHRLGNRSQLSGIACKADGMG